MLTIPRFTGKAIKVKGGWSFEFIVSFLGGSSGDETGIRSKLVYKTKDEAIKELRLEIKKLISHLAKDFDAIDPNKFIDLKSNTTRTWNDEQ